MSSSPYAPAAKILNEVWTRKKGLKTVVYSKDGELKCSSSTYAICCHVLKEKLLLSKLLQKIPEIQAKNQGLIYILLYELLMGPNKKIRGGGALKRQIMSRIDIIEKHFQKLSDEIDEKTSSDAFSKTNTVIPRYVRINTLVADRDEVLQTLKAKSDQIYIDPHVPDLLVLDHTPESRALLQDLVVSQKVILQDKSSCFSALCMVHGFEDRKDYSNTKCKQFDYLDACAAPGNKTSHLAALVHNLGKTSNVKSNPNIHALDKSPDRYKLLKRRISSLVPQGIVHCHNQDFFEVSKQKYEDNENQRDVNVDKKFENIQAIMLDPSCSGSGMTSNHTENSVSRDPFFSDDRIKTLSNFQYQALYHATTDFPHVDRVVYSTCSLYFQENEGVVQRLLASNSDWELCSPICLESWHRRGLFDEEGELTRDQTKCLIRVDPSKDATNGFFVACFQRKMKQKKGQSSKNDTRTQIHVPEGMELYNNQFDVRVENGNAEPESAQFRTESAKLSHEKSSKKEQVKTISSKRKMDKISTTAADDDEGSTEKLSNTVAKKISKKRAKKMEWKKRQRLKKEARLKKKISETQVE